ncbi:hypothetical protein [Streptomyces sp. NPDC048442]|uniref:RICIN domain-containing protein n=1 Tax=Streptomyces sp. NPDC048442 TaxID=3154823 RepID=UPI0034136F95
MFRTRHCRTVATLWRGVALAAWFACLDVYNWSTTAGDPIRRYTATGATGATNQQFSLVPVGATCGADTVLVDIAAASVE